MKMPKVFPNWRRLAARVAELETQLADAKERMDQMDRDIVKQARQIQVLEAHSPKVIGKRIADAVERIANAAEAANDYKGMSETVEKIDAEYALQQKTLKDAAKPIGEKGGD